VFPSALGLGVTFQMASGGFWPGAMLLGLANVWRRCLRCSRPRIGRRWVSPETQLRSIVSTASTRRLTSGAGSRPSLRNT
jgi:hypothetical protein